jgi:hypothetical protein
LLFEGRFAKVISCEYRYISMQNKNTVYPFNPDKLVKSQISMAKKKVPPILKLARRANPE